MANLTLVIDDDLLRRAGVRAAAEGTSVNAVAREAIQSFAGADSAFRDMAEFLEAARIGTYVSPPGWSWNRGEIYQARLDQHGTT